MNNFAMTPRERILAALKGLPIDRVPYQEIFFNHRYVSEYFGGPQNTLEDGARYLANSGQCSMLVAGFWWVPGDHYSNTNEGESRYTGGHAWKMEDVLAMEEPDIEKSIAQIKEGISAARKLNLACHIFVMSSFHSASTVMGLENLCYTLCDAPEVIHSYMDRVEAYNRKVLRRLSSYDIDFVFIDGDCAYKTGLMVSPDMFRELWFERTRGTISICQENNWPYCYHTDGKIDDVYPLLIELGFSGTHGIESAANDLADIKARFGDKLTLIGNFDISELAMCTPEEITKMTEEMLSVGSVGGRYIAGCNTLAGDNIPLENYLAFRDCIVNWK